MKRINIITILCILFSVSAFAQVKRVAIVDFEISSTNPKYNGLGKAMADMLITDMKNNVSSSKAVFIERNQINKVMEEQNFQKGASVDKNSTVAFGKVLGVNYLLTGSIFVLDGMCSIDSKLIDVSTGEIIYAESVDGNLSGWLQLKSKLGSQLSQKLALPIQKYKLEETATVSETVLTNYSSAVEATDNNNFDEAQKLLKEIRTEDANFEYSSPLMKHIIELINATKQFDEKEDAILKKAQALTDSLVADFKSKFPVPIDYEIYKSRCYGDISFGSSTLITFPVIHERLISSSMKSVQENGLSVLASRKTVFESKIDPSSRFSAEFPTKYAAMVSLFEKHIKDREKECIKSMRNKFDVALKQKTSMLDSLKTVFKKQFTETQMENANRNKQLDNFYSDAYQKGLSAYRELAQNVSEEYLQEEVNKKFKRQYEEFLKTVRNKINMDFVNKNEIISRGAYKGRKISELIERAQFEAYCPYILYIYEHGELEKFYNFGNYQEIKDVNSF